MGHDYEFRYDLAQDPGGAATGAQAERIVKASSLTFNPTTRLATFDTSPSPHGFAEGDFVNIEGANPTEYNGYQRITGVLSATTFQYQILRNEPLADDTSGAKAVRQVAAFLVHNGTTAILTTVAPHRLSIGQTVQIDAARLAGSLANPYNRHFTVTAVPTPTSFSFELDSSPSGNPTGPIRYAARWEASRLVVENNVFDLYAFDENSAERSVGLTDYAQGKAHPFMLRQWVVRGNVIRHLDNAPEPALGPLLLPVGMGFDSVQDFLIEGNVVDLRHPTAIEYVSGDRIRGLENSTPAGVRVSVYDYHNSFEGSPTRVDELATAVEDALTRAML